MTGIPWLAELKDDMVEEATCSRNHWTEVDRRRLLALIRVVEEAQKYTAPEFRNLIDAVDAAREVP